MVSVLVPARNEEKHLPDLLNSLANLDYPPDKIQILLADDQSSDTTFELIKTWCNKPNRAYIKLDASDSFRFNANGKANALSFLEQKAHGELLFFTDADCQVNPQWIKEGVASMGPEVGLVMGITQVKGSNFLCKMQEIDWWYVQGLIKIATDWGFPTTGMGNNMVIRRVALERVGGFKNLPFCLTEDLEISRSILSSGFKLVHQVSSDMLVMTKSEVNWSSLVLQRRRWMQGALTLPFYWLILILLHTIISPTLFFFGWNLIGLTVLIWVFKLIFQGLFIRFFAARSSTIPSWFGLLIFDFYYFLSSFHTILYYFWSTKVQWKSRSYP